MATSRAAKAEPIAPQQTVRDIDAKLQLAAEVGQLAIWEWDLATGQVRWEGHRFGIRNLNPDPRQGASASLLDFVVPADRDVLQCGLAHAFETGEPYQAEFRLVGSDQTVHWMMLHGRVCHDDAGHPTRMIGVVHDITDKKEAALRQLRIGVHELAEETLHKQVGILEQIHDAVFLTDMTGVLLTWNPAAARIFGYGPDEIIGHSFGVLCFPEDLAAFETRVLAPVRATGTHEVELRNRRKDGREIFVALRLAVQRDERGQPIGFICCSNDVTERKRIEEALQRQREEQQIILDAMPAMVWYKDRDNRILRANRAAAESIGKSAAELAGESAYDLYPDEAAQYHRDDLEVITSGVPKLGIVEQMQSGSGEKRWVRTDKIPYQNDRGEIVGVIVFAVDITDSQRAAEALERSRDELDLRVRERTGELGEVVQSLRAEVAERKQAEERLGLAMWATDLMVWDWNVQTGWVVYDRRWAALLGYEPDEIEPRFDAWQRLIHPDDLPFVLTALSDHIGERRTPHYEVEYRLRTKQGDYRWILARGKVVECGPGGTAVRVTGMHRDVTALKGVQEQARQQQADLAHVLRLQTVEGIAAELAHEINQPLGAIANFANGLAARLRKGTIQPDAMLDAAEQIGKQALRAGQVLQRLRDFTRKETQRLPCDINHLVRDAAALIEPDARRHKIALRLSLDPRLPRVSVDGIQVEQVILNLLRNGVDAIGETGRGGDHLSVETSLSAAGDVEVTVHDTGVGLPPGTTEQLFEPFFTTKKNGLGMGLSISRSIIEAHGGRLGALSRGERGATFRFNLPPSPPNLP